MKKLNISTKAIEPYIERIEKLSRIQRILISVGTIVVILGAFFYFSYLPKFDEIKKLREEYDKLSKKLADMKLEASQLAKYRKMMKEAEAQFKIVKMALPEKKEIPALLSSISQSGHDSGLAFLLFEPKKESKKDFYAEIPVSITVEGSYHNLGLFLSKVASLPRVVNVRDLKLKPEKGGTTLKTSCMAVTYRFVEKPPETKKAKPKKK